MTKRDLVINIPDTELEGPSHNRDDQIYNQKTRHDDLTTETSLLESNIDDDQSKRNDEQDPDYTDQCEENTSEISEGDDRNEEPHTKKPKKKTSSDLLKFSRKEVEKWRKNRNSGQHYTTAKNKQKPPRKMRDL